jgi:single-strand DNA-binding protein
MSIFTINRVVLVGRLTRDPEVRSLPSGSTVCALRIACNGGGRRDDAGEVRERPNFFDVSVFGTPGDTVARYIRKGSRVGVDGRLEWREWETDEHERRQAVSVVAERVQFLDTPAESSAPDGAGESGDGSADAGERELAGAGAGGLEVGF